MPPPRRILSFLLPRIQLSSALPSRSCALLPAPSHRALATSATHHYAVPMPPRPKVDESEIEEKFLHGSGPGGQKINKTSSAVQLKHLPTGLVVKSQETRSRTQNRKIARRILAEKLELMEKGSASRAAKLVERKQKKKSSADKKKRRKYRKLQELKSGIGGESETGQDVQVDGELAEEEGEWVLAETEYNEAEAEEDEARERDGMTEEGREAMGGENAVKEGVRIIEDGNSSGRLP